MFYRFNRSDTPVLNLACCENTSSTKYTHDNDRLHANVRGTELNDPSFVSPFDAGFYFYFPASKFLFFQHFSKLRHWKYKFHACHFIATLRCMSSSVRHRQPAWIGTAVQLCLPTDFFGISCYCFLFLSFTCASSRTM